MKTNGDNCSLNLVDELSFDTEELLVGEKVVLFYYKIAEIVFPSPKSVYIISFKIIIITFIFIIITIIITIILQLS